MKAWAKRHLPFVAPVVRSVRHAPRRARRRIVRAPEDARRLVRRTLTKGLPTDSMERRFRRIHEMNLWRGAESRSGPGSSLEETTAIRAELPRLVRDLGVRVLLDIPCGDFFWMREVEPALGLQAYIGADVVSTLVDTNARRYASDTRTFVRLDLRTDELPRADLVLCRDALDHLSYADIRMALANLVRSGSTYVLATTYHNRTNTDITTGDWRPLDLESEPIALPAPMELIDERSAKPRYPDKSLGLWRIADVRTLLERGFGGASGGRSVAPPTQ